MLIGCEMNQFKMCVRIAENKDKSVEDERYSAGHQMKELWKNKVLEEEEICLLFCSGC